MYIPQKEMWYVQEGLRPMTPSQFPYWPTAPHADLVGDSNYFLMKPHKLDLFSLKNKLDEKFPEKKNFCIHSMSSFCFINAEFLKFSVNIYTIFSFQN